jgi:3D (Asp-Asp-Asp) domain-containing protein
MVVSVRRRVARAGLLAIVAGVLAAVPASPATASTPPTGGAAIGGLVPTHHHGPGAAPPGKRARGTWLRGVTITEYWPAPESWFVGRLVKAPGLAAEHRIDWLYSAMGVSMQGEGIGLDGSLYHIDALGAGGWVTAAARPTDPGNAWSAGPPFWRAGGYWKNRTGGVTFPLDAGGWSAGTGKRYVALDDVTFAAGPSLALRFYQSIAVDPRVIPLGSRVYVPAYRHDGHGGWFIAQDTGGAVIGRHIDIYRPPPPSSGAAGQYLTNERVFVIKPRLDS